MADDLQDEIRKNASGPAKASGDAGSVEQHKLKDQIAADKHLTGKDLRRGAGGDCPGKTLSARAESTSQ